MATKAVRHETVSAKLIKHWQQVCRKLTTLAEEIPESRSNYRPVDGVRTIADVLRHVAFWNQFVADSTSGRKGDTPANELAKDRFSTKTRIVDALKRSAAGAADALKDNPSGLSPKIAEMVVTFIEHNCEHYDQLVVYAAVEPNHPAGLAWLEATGLLSRISRFEFRFL